MHPSSVRPLFAAAVIFAALSADAAPPTVRRYDPPARSQWQPDGCRYVGADDPVLGSRNRWRMLHSDAAASDEVSIALAPVFEAGWHAEPETINVTVPVFDAAGNLYFVPFLPYENVALISLDPDDGSRRWSIAGTGAPTGAVAPMTLDDPLNPGQEHVFVTLYDRAFAVTPSGSIVWDAPTGLTRTGILSNDATTGNSYIPQRDAIVGLTGSGHVYLLDRATGAQILDEPFSLPGQPSPAGEGLTIPPDLVDLAEADLTTLINFPPGSSFEGFLGAILGNSIEVSNSFAVDANTGRMWIVATAPDEADGTTDGVSELGALYGLDVIDGMSGPEIEIACRRDFVGGSASTPGVTADGTRIYVADNVGNVFAVNSECDVLWSLDLGAQITGSIAVAADNREIYASTQTDIVKIYDNGFAGEIAWTADLDVYEPGAANQSNFNTLLASIAANGIGFMAGAGIAPGDLANLGLPMKVGYGVLDRETGTVRYFADGLDESVAELDAGPDGAYYNSNSPIRRAFSRALFPGLTEPIQGGIRKFEPRRRDRLVADAMCAAGDRAANAAANELTCPDSVADDVAQIAELLAQAQQTAAVAIADGDLSQAKWDRLSQIIDDADGQGLATQAALLEESCAIQFPCPAEPRSDCLAAGDSKLMLKRSKDVTATAGKLVWKWAHGEAFSDADIGDPAASSDYAICLYVEVGAATRLAFSAAAGAGPAWHAAGGSASWSGDEQGLLRLKLRGGEGGATSVQAKAAGVAYRQQTFAVDTPVSVQLLNLETDACWSSEFVTADVLKRDGYWFKASN